MPGLSLCIILFFFFFGNEIQWNENDFQLSDSSQIFEKLTIKPLYCTHHSVAFLQSVFQCDNTTLSQSSTHTRTHTLTHYSAEPLRPLWREIDSSVYSALDLESDTLTSWIDTGICLNVYILMMLPVWRIDNESTMMKPEGAINNLQSY